MVVSHEKGGGEGPPFNSRVYNKQGFKFLKINSLFYGLYKDKWIFIF